MARLVISRGGGMGGGGRNFVKIKFGEGLASTNTWKAVRE